MAKPIRCIIENADEREAKITELILNAAVLSIQDHGFFSIGVSGGSAAKIVCQGLRGKPQGSIDWKQWRLFFCDERHVNFDDAESTYSYYKKEFFDIVQFPANNVFPINPSLSVEEAAKDYTQKIRTVYPGTELPSFDLILLGMGPDGHTCSLFPGHPGLLAQNEIVIPITNSPKPPPCRITLTIPVLNAAKRVFVIAVGGSKADAVKACLEPESGVKPLPAGLAQPSCGELIWFMDPPAAARLTAN